MLLCQFIHLLLYFSNLGMFEVPLDMDSKPLEVRLLTAKETIDKTATAPNTMINNVLLHFCFSLPLPILSRMSIKQKQTYAFSNIFGPTKQAFIWKNEVLDMMFNVKFSPEWSGLIFAIISYN